MNVKQTDFSGGINVQELPPTRIAENECVACENFGFDSRGQLVRLKGKKTLSGTTGYQNEKFGVCYGFQMFELPNGGTGASSNYVMAKIVDWDITNNNPYNAFQFRFDNSAVASGWQTLPSSSSNNVNQFRFINVNNKYEFIPSIIPMYFNYIGSQMDTAPVYDGQGGIIGGLNASSAKPFIIFGDHPFSNNASVNRVDISVLPPLPSGSMFGVADNSIIQTKDFTSYLDFKVPSRYSLMQTSNRLFKNKGFAFLASRQLGGLYTQYNFDRQSAKGTADAVTIAGNFDITAIASYTGSDGIPVIVYFGSDLNIRQVILTEHPAMGTKIDQRIIKSYSGIASRSAWVDVENDIVYVDDQKHIRSLNGEILENGAENIFYSDKLDRFTENLYFHQASMCYRNEKIYLSCSTKKNQANDITIVRDVRYGGYYIVPEGYVFSRWTPVGQFFACEALTGKVVLLEEDFYNEGQQIFSRYKSRGYDLGEPTRKKEMNREYSYRITGFMNKGTVFTFNVYYDGEKTPSDSIVIKGDSDYYDIILSDTPETIAAAYLKGGSVLVNGSENVGLQRFEVQVQSRINSPKQFSYVQYEIICNQINTQLKIESVELFINLLPEVRWTPDKKAVDTPTNLSVTPVVNKYQS
jgi:hypothetical protein